MSQWSLNEYGWCAESVAKEGNRFLIGNGALGYRGTLEEFGPEQQVGLLVSGLYNEVPGKWREPVNAPNPFYCRCEIDGIALDPFTLAPSEHSQSVDLKEALHRRMTVYSQGNWQTRISSERFLSADCPDVMGMRYTVEVTGCGEFLFTSGIDTRIWDLNGPHLRDPVCENDGKRLAVSMAVGTSGRCLVLGETVSIESFPECVLAECGGTFRTLRASVQGRLRIQLTKLAVLNVSGSSGAFPGSIYTRLSEIESSGYDQLFVKHKDTWRERWNRADVSIKGDDKADFSLRYSIWQLLIAAPFHSENLSIPARALSGQVYKGAIFWDTEIFMIPFFLATFPEVARNLLRYRIFGLKGAREKAKELGFRGAFYAWESQEKGHEACTYFNVVDVFTNRPMRTYFRDKQIHISSAISYATNQYLQQTGDLSLLWEGGLEMLLEIVRFYYSRSLRKPDSNTFVFIDVTGPDEYHERVHNNAYTNYMAQHATESFFYWFDRLSEVDPMRMMEERDRLGFTPDEEGRLLNFKTHIHLPQTDSQTSVLPQFDDYFSLEDCSLKELNSRKLHPNEYLGGGNGLATTTQVLKQADVVLLQHLLSSKFDLQTLRRSFEYYEPRTEHGSSLSACAYALIANRIGNTSAAYSYFLKTATIDLSGDSKQYVGTLYIGGTHPAANGGTWMMAVCGFAGLRFDDDGLHFEPSMPDQWKSVSFKCCWRGLWLEVSINDAFTHLRSPFSNSQNMPVFFRNQVLQIEPGESVEFNSEAAVE